MRSGGKEFKIKSSEAVKDMVHLLPPEWAEYHGLARGYLCFILDQFLLCVYLLWDDKILNNLKRPSASGGRASSFPFNGK